MKKKVITTILILLGAMLPVSASYAAPEDEVVEDTTESGSETTLDPDMGYTGPIDLISGRPVNEVTDPSEGALVQIAEGVNYDRYTRRYIYSVGNSRILSSVADGMIVTDGVILSKDGEMNLAVYRDGEALSEIPSEITEDGNYVVTTWTDNNRSQLFSFQIVRPTTGKLTQYNLPAGFEVRNVLLEGRAVSHGVGTVSFSEEGSYVVDYVCNANSVEYTLKVKIDHTPPTIDFLGLDEEDEARGPVTIFGLTEGDVISITFDDEEQVTMDDDNQVSETGYYHVVVTDAAGNFIEKDFRILLYLNFNAAMFIIAFVLVILGVYIALKVSRKRLRVR